MCGPQVRFHISRLPRVSKCAVENFGPFRIMHHLSAAAGAGLSREHQLKMQQKKSKLTIYLIGVGAVAIVSFVIFCRHTSIASSLSGGATSPTKTANHVDHLSTESSAGPWNKNDKHKLWPGLKTKYDLQNGSEIAGIQEV